MLRYFNRSLPVARARVNATMGISGGFWPETSTLFGTYDAVRKTPSFGGSFPYVCPEPVLAK
jgi:hypothetical protein